MILEMTKLPAHKMSMLLDKDSKEIEHAPLIIPEGKRNDFLCSIAGYMRHRGLNPDQVENVLMAVNKSALNPVEPQKESIK